MLDKECAEKSLTLFLSLFGVSQEMLNGLRS
jgi:hypothetical protein